MSTITESTSGVSISNPIPVNVFLTEAPYSVGVKVTGAATLTIEVQINTADWFPVIAGQTADFLHVVTSPVTAVRLNQTVGLGSATITLTTGKT